jgi:hypothetical protein
MTGPPSTAKASYHLLSKFDCRRALDFEDPFLRRATFQTPAGEFSVAVASLVGPEEAEQALRCAPEAVAQITGLMRHAPPGLVQKVADHIRLPLRRLTTQFLHVLVAHAYMRRVSLEDREAPVHLNREKVVRIGLQVPRPNLGSLPTILRATAREPLSIRMELSTRPATPRRGLFRLRLRDGRGPNKPAGDRRKARRFACPAAGGAAGYRHRGRCQRPGAVCGRRSWISRRSASGERQNSPGRYFRQRRTHHHSGGRAEQPDRSHAGDQVTSWGGAAARPAMQCLLLRHTMAGAEEDLKCPWTRRS